MHISKTFFVLVLVISTHSLRTMNFDKLSSPRNNEIVLRLIKNMMTHTADKDKSIRTMSRDIKALSLTNKKWHGTLNSFSFTDKLIKSLTYQLRLKELRIANNILTLGGNLWRQKYLEGMNFY